MPITERPDSPQRLTVQAAGRTWILERPADLESLWQSLDEDNPKAEEHIPYWVELWPATLALCGWLARQDLAGRRCLDIGCGLGLSALVASNLGAHVAGMDYERNALYFAARNARLNAVQEPLWLCMDWNRPGFATACFERIWGGDIFYEQRFFDPLESLLRSCLAPGGRVWFGDPERTVSSTVWSRFSRRGWRVNNQGQEVVSLGQARMTVNLWELSRP
jgi:predicted nicotinamide N-methyase